MLACDLRELGLGLPAFVVPILSTNCAERMGIRLFLRCRCACFGQRVLALDLSFRTV